MPLLVALACYVCQDGIFLALQEQRLRAAGKGSADWAKEYYMPTSCDRAMIQARRWIESISGGPFGLGGGLRPAGSAEASRRDLLDR